MKARIIISLLVAITMLASQLSLHASMAVGLWVYYILDFFMKVVDRIAFKEFIMVLYGLNFLWGPMMTYYGDDKIAIYSMKIDEVTYFNLAIPAMLALHIGMNMWKSSLFKPDFRLLQIHSFLNASILKSWVIAGILLSMLKGFVPQEAGFFIYLLGMVRYVGAFGLYIINRRKYKWYILAVLGLQLSESLVQGMFHDTAMWIIFFTIIWMYLTKPKVVTRVLIVVIGVFMYFLLQISKGSYREELASGTGGVETFYDVLLNNLDDENILSDENYNTSVSRVNQAWIFASTVDNMERKQDFQQLNLVEKYLEAALLPRVWAPDKLKAGDKEIFNTYSGHRIGENTSMGLGIFADGYIAYGAWGVIAFAFALGLIFSLIFKIVSKWTTISPFFVFLIFPVLNYAIRPDCETQTLLGHVVKGLLVFWALMFYYKGYFNKKIVFLKRLNPKPA